MTAAPEATESQRLAFRMVGSWTKLDPQDLDGAAKGIKHFVERALGNTDQMAAARAALRQRLHDSLEASQGAESEAMFLCSHLDDKTPMPVTMTVFAPASLRMSPAVGTDAEAVAEVFAKSIELTSPETAATLTTLAIPGSVVSRAHRFTSHDLAPGVPDTEPARGLIADYWYTVPDSKQVILVSFYTPLADIPNAMLEFFDSIVRASRFTSAPATQEPGHPEG